MKKLAIVSSHPIQYNAPLFRLLANNPQIDLHVFYTWEQALGDTKYDPGFGRNITWDIPLLEGYAYTSVKNIAADPGTHHFKGLVNPGLIRQITAWKPDAILVFGWNFHSHLACMRHFHGRIPILFRGDSTLLNEQPGLRKIMRRIFLKWVYRYVDYALHVGLNSRNYFLAHGLRESQLVLAPHAIDNRRFMEPGQDYENRAGEWRKDLGLHTDDLVLLFAGKLENVKNPFFIVSLAEKTKGSGWKFLLVGNGILETSLKERAAANPEVLLLDFQNQLLMPLVYRLGNAVILPSISETWGLAINEAMACGRPVLLSNKAGGAVDLIEDGHNGFMIDPADVDQCARLLTDLAKNRDRLAQMGTASREKIRDFSYERIAREIETLLNRL